MFNEPERNPNRTLNLTVEDASCTEAWIKLNETNAELPASVKLYANDTLKQTLELTTADTLIYDEGLLPNRAYAYRAELIKPQKPTVKSQTVTATTLDTTSHDFTWETFTFGGANGSSYLRDVAIINENDIWAVGEIHTSWTDQWDSNGVWVQPYNAVHWNGQEWELVRIGGYGYWAYNTVYAFSENDVWFDGTVQWNGQTYTAHVNNFPLEPNGDAWRVYGMWGTSSSDFYIVGQHGNIAHYDGSGWGKIESGTEVKLRDVWGSSDGSEIYACGYNLGDGFTTFLVINAKDKSVYKLYEGMSNGEIDGHLVNFIAGVYSYGKKVYSMNLTFLYDLRKINPPKIKLIAEWNWAGESINGDGYNDIMISGQGGLLLHYNGLSVKKYAEFSDNYLFLYGTDIKDGTAVAVGMDYQGAAADSPAVIYLGRR